jgi:hypothetical protein
MIKISPQSSRSPGLADHWTAELPRGHSSANGRLSPPIGGGRTRDSERDLVLDELNTGESLFLSYVVYFKEAFVFRRV